MHGLTILALVINRICPHYKVDMYLEIEKMKKENLEKYENNLKLFFDSICYHKLHIDQKNPLAYTDDQFVRDIFKQLRGKQLPPAFCLEFEHAKIKWLMNRENYSSESLMNEVSLYYFNLKSSGGWKIETNKHQQIIALTTQIDEMNDKLSKLTPKTGNTPVIKIPGNSQEIKGMLEPRAASYGTTKL